MLEQTLRHYYQRALVDPVARLMPERVTPIHVTLAAGVFGVLLIPALLGHHPILAIFFLLLSGYCDTLDGTIARLRSKSSSLGTVLDIMMDRCVEFITILGLYLIHPQERALMTILLLGAILLCITSFLVVAIFTPNDSEKSFHYSPGLIERAETFAFFIVMIVWPSLFNYLAILLTLLIGYTTYLRLYQFILASRMHRTYQTEQ